MIFEAHEVLTQSGTPYGVFTPNINNWLSRVAPEDVRTHDSTPLAHRLRERPPEFQRPVPSLGDIGFAPTKRPSLEIPTGSSGGQALFEDFF